MRSNTAGVTFFALMFGLMLLSSAPTFASASTTSQTAAPAPKATPSPFGISASIGKTLSLYDFQDGSRVEENSLELVPSYSWSLGKTLLVMSFADDVRNPGNSSMGDIVIVNAFKPWDFARFKLSSGVSVVVPQSKDSKENSNLQTAISGKLTAAIQKHLLQPGFRFSGNISLSRSFHRYDTAVDGRVLNQQSSSQGLAAGYDIGPFSFDVDFRHNNSWSYQGNMKESYGHREEASVGFADHYSFAVGHSNDGSVFKADGYSSNYKLIDENNSLVYATLSMQF